MPLNWIRLPSAGNNAFGPNTTGAEIIYQLQAMNDVSLEALNRSVYAIRLHSDFVIRYPKEISPLLYIGEGNFINRIADHRRNWLSALAEEQAHFAYSIWFCLPRVQNNVEAYKSVEAHLIKEFQSRFGTIPLYNRQLETEYYMYQYTPDFYRVFLVGQGRRPKWAVMPCRSHPAYERYFRGFNWETDFQF
jgi:hypothetical protein